ncbi:MAG: hypothetical protein ACI8YQ_003838 [Polaribacter sp.]|jgi:hypothetical protein
MGYRRDLLFNFVFSFNLMFLNIEKKNAHI